MGNTINSHLNWGPQPCVSMPVADLGGGGGSGGCNPPKSSEPYIQNALLILC